jgi:hypothetical protein
VNIVLNPAEARVLGSLVEKNITIPTAFTERADQCLQPEEQPRAGNVARSFYILITRLSAPLAVRPSPNKE